MIGKLNKTDRHDIAKILWKVALKNITLTPNPVYFYSYCVHRMVFNIVFADNNVTSVCTTVPA
jgi:hypothetical protein